MNKVKLLCAAILLLACVGAKAQQNWIQGFYERHGDGDYTLTKVHTQGILIDGKTDLKDKTFRGGMYSITCGNIPADMVRFSFEKADFNCNNPKITFQYWDEDINNWKTDVEACKGQAEGKSTKDMVMMLVLDYSSSLKEKRELMQKMAINFISKAVPYSEGNIHVGIVAFSGMRMIDTMPITPLTKDNLYKFERFIRNAKSGMETALYYSFDKAMNMIENYVYLKGFTKNNYNGSTMITFTDGLDNASINDQISKRMQRGSKNEYLNHLSEIVQPGQKQKFILGEPVGSWMVGFTGSEHFTNEDLILFKTVLEKLTTERFLLSDNFNEVERFFGEIFENLTKRWKTLNLYIGEAQYGDVRWLIDCGEPKPQPKPKPEPEPEPIDNGKNGYFQITIGGAKPVGEFSYSAWEDNWPYCGLEGKSEYGGAGLGITVGLQGKIGIRSVKGLGITISADGFFNGLNSEIMDKYQRMEDEYDENPSYEIKLKTPKYINSALMAGVNYEYEFSDAFKVFAGLGMGVNLRWITKLQENERNEYDGSVVYNYVLNYDTKMSFAYKAELGVVLGEKFVVSLGYFNLGAAKVEGTVHFSEEGQTEDLPFHFSKITPKYLTFSVGTLLSR